MFKSGTFWTRIQSFWSWIFVHNSAISPLVLHVGAEESQWKSIIAGQSSLEADVTHANRSLSKMRSRCFCQTTGFPVPTLYVLNATNLPAAGQFILIAHSLESLSLMTFDWKDLLHQPPSCPIFIPTLTGSSCSMTFINTLELFHVYASSYEGNATHHCFSTWIL